jgi:hypothetical protein
MLPAVIIPGARAGQNRKQPVINLEVGQVEKLVPRIFLLDQLY